MKKLLFLIFVLFYLSRPLDKIYAAQYISESYTVLYDILENGETKVNLDVILKNNDSRYYADSYKIKLGFEDIKNLKGYDLNGSLDTQLQKGNDGQEIYTNFNRKNFGLGNTHPFTISFTTKDIAKKLGNVWEVNIPGLSNQNEFSSFNVEVKVPLSFGEIAYIKPASTEASLKFTKEQLGKSGISVAFGKKQLYKFNLKYHLKNPSIFPVKTEIAIPSSTNYQNVYIDNISPKPINVVKDLDGNWLAQYNLSSSQKVDVIVNGKAEIFLSPKKEELSPEKKQLYLKENTYWEENEKIKKIAAQLKTPYAIYGYVVKTLSYDFSKAENGKPRLGANKILENPQSAVCLEFTDLFIALSRAAGIPAREVNGFAYTENEKQKPLSLIKDILHAWPEYYDNNQQTWIMIDPTWENTTKGIDYFNVLDLNHFAFIIRGVDSVHPVPAGSYKIQNTENNKDVFVDFTSEDIIQSPKKIELISVFPPQTLSVFPVEGFIILRNNGQSAYKFDKITVESKFLKPGKTEISVSEIPPFGFLKIPIAFKKTGFFTKNKTEIKISAGNKILINEIEITPFSLNDKKIIFGGILSVILTIIIFIFVARTRRVFFSR